MLTKYYFMQRGDVRKNEQTNLHVRVFCKSSLFTRFLENGFFFFVCF